MRDCGLIVRFREWLRLYHPRYCFILNLPIGSKVLDIGCGDFSAMKKFKELRSDLVFSGVDIKDVVDLKPNDVSFYKCDIQKDELPFDNNSFDAIYCSHVLEHLYSINLLLDEIKRVLKDSGQLYIETPSPRSLWFPSIRYGQEQGIPINFYDDPTHQKPFSKTGLFILLKSTNFKDIIVGTARNPWLVILSPYILLRGLISKNRLLLTLAIWEIVGWSIYAVGKNKSRTG